MYLIIITIITTRIFIIIIVIIIVIIIIIILNNNNYYDVPGKEGPHAARHLLASSLEAALSATQGSQPDPGAARCEKKRGDSGKFVYKPL
jgi:hypothetical protein